MSSNDLGLKSRGASTADPERCLQSSNGKVRADGRQTPVARIHLERDESPGITAQSWFWACAGSALAPFIYLGPHRPTPVEEGERQRPGLPRPAEGPPSDALPEGAGEALCAGAHGCPCPPRRRLLPGSAHAPRAQPPPQALAGTRAGWRLGGTRAPLERERRPGLLGCQDRGCSSERLAKSR